MKKILLLIVALFFFGLNDMLAQQQKTHSLSLNIGAGNIMRQDLSFSPFIHKDWSPLNVQLIFNRSKNLKHRVTARFGSYNPFFSGAYPFHSFYNGDIETIPHTFTMVDLNYALGKSIWQAEKWEFTLGGKSKNQIHMSGYDLGDAGSSGYFVSFGLNAWMNLQMILNDKHRLESSLSIPVLAYNARPPYLSQDDQFFMNILSHKPLKILGNYIKNGQLESWGKSQSVDFDFSYSFSLSEKFDVGCRYLFLANFNQNPTKYIQVENLFYLNLNYKF